MFIEFPCKGVLLFWPGCQGAWTLFPDGNKQILKELCLSFKMIPRTVCHPGGAANSKSKAFFEFQLATRLLSVLVRKDLKV